jgi:hypothetical protein
MDKFLKPLQYIMQIYFYQVTVHFKTLFYAVQESAPRKLRKYGGNWTADLTSEL